MGEPLSDALEPVQPVQRSGGDVELGDQIVQMRVGLVLLRVRSATRSSR
jgi:hypothetical protein